jgi:hypothetical protein
MSYTGTIKNGVVVLPGSVRLPEGTQVELTPVVSSQEAEGFTDQLLGIAKQTLNLPPDLAANHDHYLHGLPKK